MVEQFVGTWELLDWQYLIDGQSRPLWKENSGLLIYTEEGMMSAILMDKSRPHFEYPYIALGSPSEKESAIDGYVSYAGKFTVDEKMVRHHVQFSLLPNWINTILERNYVFKENGQILILSTELEYSPKGKSIENILTWKRKK